MIKRTLNTGKKLFTAANTAIGGFGGGGLGYGYTASKIGGIAKLFGASVSIISANVLVPAAAVGIGAYVTCRAVSSCSSRIRLAQYIAEEEGFIDGPQD
jgi:hypothetical protein